MPPKRPANGCNYANRRSNMTSKSNGWKEQLVQGDREKEVREAVQSRIDAEVKYQKELKQKLRAEALQADIDNGFVDPAELNRNKEVPEWKKYKMFLAEAFPEPTVCRRYTGEMVFKNKLCLQQYHHRVATAEEWERNVALLAAMRKEMDDARAAEAGFAVEDVTAAAVGDVGRTAAAAAEVVLAEGVDESGC